MRKILIVPEGKVKEHHQMASDDNISEVVEGIPLGLSHLYKAADLPLIHTEEPVIISPTETELLNEKITTLRQQLDSATDVIDFLLMGGI